MRHREQGLGNKNLVGKNVSEERKKRGLQQKELLARLQVAGVDISPSSLSKLEGQTRLVTDKELVAIAGALNVTTDDLLKKRRKKKNKNL